MIVSPSSCLMAQHKIHTRTQTQVGHNYKKHTDCQHDSLTLLLSDGATILSPPLDLWSWVTSCLARKHHVLSLAYNLFEFQVSVYNLV